jgi:hypothetical protein
VEADTFVMQGGRRVSVDFKHDASVGETLITDDLLARVENALQAAQPDLDEWWFAASGNVTSERFFTIEGINTRLRELFPDRWITDPIKVIEQLGDF